MPADYKYQANQQHRILIKNIRLISVCVCAMLQQIRSAIGANAKLANVNSPS